jgi:hypothetical protein
MTLEAQATAFCEALNARAAMLTAEGRRPLYRNFGFELGRKYARIFSTDGAGSRSASAFVDVEGVVRRADSWKKAGRIVGRCDELAAIAYVGGPV